MAGSAVTTGGGVGAASAEQPMRLGDDEPAGELPVELPDEDESCAGDDDVRRSENEHDGSGHAGLADRLVDAAKGSAELSGDGQRSPFVSVALVAPVRKRCSQEIFESADVGLEAGD